MQRELVRPVLIEEVERTNTVVIRNLLQGQIERGGEMRRNLYVMNVDRGRNCYNCGEFGHLVRNCRNYGLVGQERRIKYRDNIYMRDNLKEKESLVVCNVTNYIY